jgi:hypothetical protein
VSGCRDHSSANLWSNKLRAVSPCLKPQPINLTSIRWNASTVEHVSRYAQSRLIFALDDLPEKWAHFTQINSDYFGKKRAVAAK